MKKTILLIAILFSVHFLSYAQTQWTTSGSNIYFTGGNAGIGTTSPGWLLDMASNTNATAGFQFTNSNTGTSARSRFILSNGTNSATFILNGSAYTTDPNALLIYVPSGTGSMIFGTSGTERMRLLSNGNLGINASSPLSAFQLNTNFTMVSLGSASNANLYYGTGYIGFNAARTESSGTWTSHGDGSHNGGGVIYSDISGNMYFSIIPTSGTTDQTHADLDIKNDIKMMISRADGSVHAKAVIVTLSGWPDYVFNRSYKLPGLAAVKDYIDLNHHLPDMPSADEVAKNGLNLGATNKLLTQKVEELTLYLIKTDKQLDEEKGINTKQQSQLDAQASQLKKYQSRLEMEDERIKNLEDAVRRLSDSK